MKQLARVLALVTRAPVHCHDVSTVLGMPLRTASARLSDLHAAGLVIRRRRYVPIGCASPCWLYERKSA